MIFKKSQIVIMTLVFGMLGSSRAAEIYRMALGGDAVVASLEEGGESKSNALLPNGAPGQMSKTNYSAKIELVQASGNRVILRESKIRKDTAMTYNPGSLFSIFGAGQLGDQLLLAFNEDLASYILVATRLPNGEYVTKVVPAPKDFHSDAQVKFSVGEGGISISTSYGGEPVQSFLANPTLEKIQSVLKNP